MQARLLREHNEHVRIVVFRLCIVDPRKPNILWSIICNAIRVTNIRSIDLRIHIPDLLDKLFHVLLRGPGHLLDGQMGDVLLLLKLVHDRVTISPRHFCLHLQIRPFSTNACDLFKLQQPLRLRLSQLERRRHQLNISLIDYFTDSLYFIYPHVKMGHLHRQTTYSPSSVHILVDLNIHL